MNAKLQTFLELPANKRLKSLLKILDNDNSVFDYDAINDLGFPYNILIAERGAKGKTYGIKDFLFRQFLSHWNTMKEWAEVLWLRSLATDAKIESDKWLIDVPPVISNEFDKMRKTPTEITYETKPFVVFNNVSTSNGLKGTRTTTRHIVWDEFNDSIKYFKASLIENFANKQSSTRNNQDADQLKNQKVWLLGNNRGINHPFLIKNGIDKITEEVTMIFDDNGKPLILLIMPIYNEDDIAKIEERNADDPFYQLNKRMGTADQIYYNRSSIDDVNYIFEHFALTLKNFTRLGEGWPRPKLKCTFKINGQLLNLYDLPYEIRSDLKTAHHVMHVDLYCSKPENKHLNKFDLITQTKDQYVVLTTNKAELEEEVYLLPPVQKNNLIKTMAMGNISFENVSSRELFIELLKR